MALVEKDDMTTLRPASDSRSTAQTAEKDIQIKAIAFAINSAANTGEMRAIYQGTLLEEVIAEVKGKGYTVEDCGIATLDRKYVISWKE